VVRTIAVAAALSCACDADFIDPNPPRLVRMRTEYQTQPLPEPAVWLLVADLYLEHDEDCAATVAWLQASIQAAVPQSAAGTLALPPLQTSPCTQPNSRTIDPAAIDAALRGAEAAFPGHPVRSVIVYANNVILAIPGQIATALDSARQLAVARGALQPRLWAVLPAALVNRLRTDQTLVWTYAGDPAIAAGLAQIVSRELPFTSDGGLPSPALEVFANGPAGVRLFKVCEVDPNVEVLGFPGDGSAVTLDAASPPEYRVTLAPHLAVPRAAFQPQRAGLEVEACLGNCDRYFGDDRVRWLTRQGCLLTGGPS
jgi:hypothetical protein